MEQKTKTCSKCKETKSSTEFYVSKSRLDKLAVYCKECEKKIKKKKEDEYASLYGLI
jgi:hypothetical protein